MVFFGEIATFVVFGSWDGYPHGPSRSAATRVSLGWRFAPGSGR